MQLLQSNKLPLPIIYLVEDQTELLKLPLGIPFIVGSSKNYKHYVQMLEFEILLKSAIKSGLPFKWEQILRMYKYDNFRKFLAHSDGRIAYTGEPWGLDGVPEKTIIPGDFIEDISYQVDIEYLKNLKIIPTWFSEDIEQTIKINILDSITYNPTLYNKKLNLMVGAPEYNNPEKNLIIIDVSGSIPVSISKACLLLSKTMATQFYADLIITGRTSTFYDYNEVANLDVDSIYEIHGNNNEQAAFKNILSTGYNKYNTVICFGDNHSPSQQWGNSKAIPIEEGKKLCKWQVKNIMSFHTTSETSLAGYACWFTVPEDKITYMKDWVKYLDK